MMNDLKTGGSVRLRVCQIDVRQGRPADNTSRMLEAIANAKRDSVGLVVFPELAVCGSALGNRWNNEAFLRECEQCGEAIRAASEGLIVVFGNVAVDWMRRNSDGSVRKYNALFVAEDGRFIGPVNGPHDFIIKSCSPGRPALEPCFFDIGALALEQGTTVEHLVSPVTTGGISLGCMLCGGLSGERFSSSLQALNRHPVNLIVAAGDSMFMSGGSHERERLLASHATASAKPLVYVGASGIVDNGKIIRACEGASLVFDGSGALIGHCASFSEQALSIAVPFSAPPSGRAHVPEPADKIAGICSALLHGIDLFSMGVGISRVVVGVSGGIDSAVVAALYSRVFSAENLLLVNLPSRFVSPGGRALARELAANLCCFYGELPIDESVALTAMQVNGFEISGDAGRLKQRLVLSDFMMENIQARDRSSRLLAALASAFGGVFTCNANKSESTVGYSTFYGDLAGYLAPIADLWKGEVYELGRYLNGSVFGRDVIPRECFERVPSAELNNEQNADEGGGDPLLYRYHDRLFKSWVEREVPAGPEEILEWYLARELEEKLGYDGSVERVFPEASLFVEDLERWWKQFQGMAAAKRNQAPPMLAVKERPLGAGRGEPQLGAWFGGRYVELKKRVLK